MHLIVMMCLIDEQKVMRGLLRMKRMTGKPMLGKLYDDLILKRM